jgi:hypothetical protein
MRSLLKMAGVASCACALLAGAPAAMASGGRPTVPPAPSSPAPAAGGGSGGGAGGGGGGGGGGGNSRGVINDVVAPPAPPPPPPPPPVTPCATLTSVTAPVGYYLTYAAVWNDFTVRSCATGIQTVFVEAIEADPTTGLTAYDVTVAYSMAPGQNVAGIIDNDFAPFDTTYTVTYKVTDTSGNLLDSQSTSATTPPPR